MELFNILFQFSLFISFFLLVPCAYLPSGHCLKNKYNLIEYLLFHLIVHINILLFLSFLNIQIKTILLIYFIFLSFILVLFIKNFYDNFYMIKSKYIYFVIILILYLLISTDIANSIVLGWDSQKFWIYKTINFFDGGSIETLRNLEKGDGYDYPYLGSLLWSIYWKLSFVNEEYTGRLFFVFLYIISIFSLVERLKATLSAKILFLFIFILLSYDYVYFQGEQDILIFSFIACAASLCSKIKNDFNMSKSFSNYFLLILLCNCLVWTKAEGSIYAIIIFISILTLFNIKKKYKIFLLCALMLILILRILIYNFYDLNVGVNSCCWNDLSISGIVSRITFDRIFLIIEYFIYAILKNPLIILSFIFIVFSLNKRQFIKNNLHNYLFIFFSFAFIFSAYLLTDVDLKFMLKTGIDRLLYSISPYFIILIIEYFNSQKLKA